MTSTVDGGPVRARAGWAWPAVAGLLLLATLAPEPAHAQTGICGRTEAVRDAILAAIEGVGDCDLVTGEHLVAITGELNLTTKSITTLAAGDFAGLSALTILDLSSNALTALPAGVFDELTALTVLNLRNNTLATLPSGVFEPLTALTRLHFNSLTTLPDDVFEELTLADDADAAGQSRVLRPHRGCPAR